MFRIRRCSSPWHILGPEVLYWAPRHLKSIWDVKEIYVTENGCAERRRDQQPTAPSTIRIE